MIKNGPGQALKAHIKFLGPLFNSTHIYLSLAHLLSSLLNTPLRLQPPRDEGIGLLSFPPSSHLALCGTHWKDDDDDHINDTG